MLIITQIALLVLWFTVLPALPWWIALLPALVAATWFVFRLGALAGVIIHDYRHDTHTPFFK
jgi:hypothetical protein